MGTTGPTLRIYLKVGNLHHDHLLHQPAAKRGKSSAWKRGVSPFFTVWNGPQTSAMVKTQQLNLLKRKKTGGNFLKSEGRSSLNLRWKSLEKSWRFHIKKFESLIYGHIKLIVFNLSIPSPSCRPFSTHFRNKKLPSSLAKTSNYFHSNVISLTIPLRKEKKTPHTFWWLIDFNHDPHFFFRLSNLNWHPAQVTEVGPSLFSSPKASKFHSHRLDGA